ncbi:hypothetical protein ASB7_12920 [Helicobacter ailurogastricus]|nr:hypothetical protein ASB7_12920 [Helicobacter ailurogastricus]
MASWVISPVMGGGIAMGLMVLFKQSISDREDKKSAALKTMPLVVGVMGLAFSWFMLAKVLHVSLGSIEELLLSVGVGLLAYNAFKSYVASKLGSLENTKESVHTLFTLPLVFSAALLSFAHGANDVANAVGPLAAIVQSLQEWGSHAIPTKAYAPRGSCSSGGLASPRGLVCMDQDSLKLWGAKSPN